MVESKRTTSNGETGYVCGMSVGSAMYGLCPRPLPPQANAWYKGRLFAPVEAETSRPRPPPPLLRTRQSSIRSLNFAKIMASEAAQLFFSHRVFESPRLLTGGQTPRLLSANSFLSFNIPGDVGTSVATITVMLVIDYISILAAISID